VLLQICDLFFAAIVENHLDNMNITYEYSTDEGGMVALNSCYYHVNATIKEAMISISHEKRLCMTQAYD